MLLTVLGLGPHLFQEVFDLRTVWTSFNGDIILLSDRESVANKDKSSHIHGCKGSMSRHDHECRRAQYVLGCPRQVENVSRGKGHNCQSHQPADLDVPNVDIKRFPE